MVLKRNTPTVSNHTICDAISLSLRFLKPLDCVKVKKKLISFAFIYTKSIYALVTVLPRTSKCNLECVHCFNCIGKS